MTTPIRVRCKGTFAIPSVAEIRAMADADHHVVLEFPVKLKVNKPPIVAELSAALSEYSVFDSGGNKETDWVTVMPVISDGAIQSYSREIKDAAAMYITTCSSLLDGH